MIGWSRRADGLIRPEIAEASLLNEFQADLTVLYPDGNIEVVGECLYSSDGTLASREQAFLSWKNNRLRQLEEKLKRSAKAREAERAGSEMI